MSLASFFARSLSLFYLCIKSLHYTLQNALFKLFIYAWSPGSKESSHGGTRIGYRLTGNNIDPDMSSTSNTSKPEEKAAKALEKPKSDDIQHLGVLEEDDEFEEFECAGEHSRYRAIPSSNTETTRVMGGIRLG